VYHELEDYLCVTTFVTPGRGEEERVDLNRDTEGKEKPKRERERYLKRD
jgi:hypothetical protein